ncbi:aldehyde dehydrogenase family protein [Patescibacteria group bacterium]|nr:aldehyde dehydrogenase family protein [Patescibacteria group bacterium]
MDHSDTEKMIADSVACRISNGGQRCNASKRFIILEKHYDLFVERMAAHMERLTIGDPMDVATQLPPIARTDLVNEIDKQVQKTISEG